MRNRRMRAGQWIQVATMASAFGLVGAAVAADYTPAVANDSDATNATARGTNTSSPMGTDSVTSQAARTPGAMGADGGDKASTSDFDTWMGSHAAMHDGRITRAEFMAQMSNRWDRLDTRHQGSLTLDQARSIYGSEQPAAMDNTVSDTMPGGRTPGDIKTQ